MKFRFSHLQLLALCVFILGVSTLCSQENSMQAEQVLDRVRQHDFNPIRDGFTFDPQLNKHGVADLDDMDWQIRTLAVRELV